MDFKKFSCAGFYILDPTEKWILLGLDKYLSPQKGGVEPTDDTLFKTATRETMEESGISVQELQFSTKEYIEYGPSGKPNILYWCCKLKQPKNEFKFDSNELKSVEWYDIDELLKNKDSRLKPQRLDILKQMMIDLPNVTWVDDITEKRVLKCNPEKKKNPVDVH
jgi:8-oxo-dGTP pyrophosphatase MutT (NUDIX family)